MRDIETGHMDKSEIIQEILAMLRDLYFILRIQRWAKIGL